MQKMRLILAILLRGVVSIDHPTGEPQKLRIIGGKSVNIKDYPYQLCIVIKKTEGVKVTEYRGGAVIVSSRWAMTAAHCVTFISGELFSAGLVYLRGNTSFWRSTKDSNDHKIILTTVHPQYNEDTNDYDLALLKVKNPFNGIYEKPVKVATNAYQLPKHAKVTVSGWGLSSNEEEEPQPRLKAVDVKVVDYNTCKKIYANAVGAKISNRMVCAWDAGKDACVYDSGGPLLHNKVLTGVVSWGMRCASAVYPGVYSKISAFYAWIRNYEKVNKISLKISFANNKGKIKQSTNIKKT